MENNLNLTFEKTELAYALNAAVKAVTASNIETSDSYIYITADKDKSEATIKASNYTNTVCATVQVDVITAGAVCVIGKLFAESVNKITAGEINLKVEGKQAVISYDGGEIKMPALENKDEPKFPAAKPAFTISPDKFRRLIAVTQNFIPAAACVNSNLEGAYIEAADGTITMTGCDGYHAAQVKCAAEVKTEVKATIPLKGVKLINQIVGKGGDIEVGVSKNALTFKQEDIEISAALLAGTYPIVISRLIPTAFLTEVTVDRAKLIEVIGRATLFTTTTDGKGKPIGFEITENEIRAAAQNDNGLLSESLKAKTTGKDLEIYFNVKYMQDILNALTDDEITLKLNSETSPMAVNGNDGVFIILPVRMNKGV